MLFLILFCEYKTSQIVFSSIITYVYSLHSEIAKEYFFSFPQSITFPSIQFEIKRYNIEVDVT